MVEAAGRPVNEIFNIINEFTRKIVNDPVTKVLEKGMIVGLANHTILVRKDKTEIAIDDSAAPIKSKDGKTTGVVLIFRDVTEQRKAEEALKMSERKFKSLADNAPDAIMRFDKNLRILYLNPQDLAATGKTLEELIGKTNEEIGMPLELCKLWNGMFDKAKTSGQVQHVDFDFSTSEGLRTYSLRIVPEFAKDGSVVSYIGISRDITERKKAEEALRESEGLYRTLFDNTEDGFVLVEPIYNEAGKSNDYVMLQVNRTWELQTGLRAVDFEGKRIRDVMPNVEPVWRLVLPR